MQRGEHGGITGLERFGARGVGQPRAANSAGRAAKKWLTAFGLTNITSA